MKDLISFIVKNIVESPDKIAVQETQINSNFSTFQIKAAEKDIGKIIGKGGKIIQSIRNVAKIKAIKEGKHIRIEIG